MSAPAPARPRPAAVAPGSGRVRGLWWLSPPGAVAFITVPTLLLAWSIDDATYRLAWGTPKALQAPTVALLLLGALLFMAGGLATQVGPRRPESLPWPGLSLDQRRLLVRASRWLYRATVFGYLAFAAVGASRGVTPGMVVAAFTGQDTSGVKMKDAFASIAGVTTFTQFGVAYVVVATVVLLGGWVPRLAWRVAVLFGLAVFRAFLVSERLALLELAVPVLALLAMRFSGSGVAWVRGVLRALPALLVPAVLAVFGIFEYSRSWQFYKARTNGTFLDFAVERLSGYYVTAYNNGQLAILYERLPGRLPGRTLEVLWTAPVVEQMGIYERFSAPGSAGLFQDILAQHANPEFNNPGGLTDPFVDWGPVGGLVLLLVAGLLLGLAYRSFANARPMALLVYPPMVTGLFELPRYLYWSQGRLAPALFGLVVTGLLLGRQARAARAREGPAP